MNFDQSHTRKHIEKLNSVSVRVYHKLGVWAYKAVILLILFVIGVGASFAYGSFQGILEGTPELNIDDVTPSGYASTMYDNEGNEMMTLVQAGSNRTRISYEDLPSNLVNAFIAIEDERFMTHNGIDLKGILRAGMVAATTLNLSEGASTITQQLIKNNIFAGGAETSNGDKIERKIQEQYLALQLEQQVSKEWIMENYLNTINLGNNTLGVQSAATRYFGKDVGDLTLSECAVIAAITQNPSKYNPIRFPENNKERATTVLNKMLSLGFITQAEYEDAIADDVYARIENISSGYATSTYTYFEDSVIEEVVADLQTELGYSQTQAYNLLYSGGLHIYTTQDTDIQKTMDKYVNDPDNYPNSQYSCTYYLKLTHADGTTSSYTEHSVKNFFIKATGNEDYELLFNSEEEMRSSVEAFKASVLADGDTIQTENLQSVLEPQLSMTIIDNRTGYVVAISGGRGTKTSSLSLNRATDSTRQPGSCFKVLADFAPAIDLCGDTLASVYYDSPLESGDMSFSNWWGDGYVGYANIRQGILYSMNMIAVKCLINTVTPQIAYKYVTDFGITTLVENRDGMTDVVPSICLGGLTDGVTNLELTAAYETIANGGVYTEPIFYTKVTDANGKTLLTNEQEQHTVLKASTATLLTKAMEHIFDDTPLYTAKDSDGNCITIQPTCVGLGLESMPAAGKSGSSTSDVDVWFEGYTPYYTCGVWGGYDDTIAFGSGQDFHKKIWKLVMDEVHEDLPVIEFTEYAPVETAKICSKSGLLAVDGVCDSEESNSYVYEEYFAEGTAPTEYCNVHVSVNVCTTSNQLAGENCPDKTVTSHVYMLLDSSLIYDPSRYDKYFKTYDEEFTMPASLNETCGKHTGKTNKKDDSKTDSTKSDKDETTAATKADDSKKTDD